MNERLQRQMAPIDPDLAKALIEHLEDIGEERRNDVVSRMKSLLEFLWEHADVYGVTNKAEAMASFQCRMEALRRLRNLQEYRAWSMEIRRAEREGDLIDEVLLETAATHPLQITEGEPAFDATSFFKAALEKAEIEGRA